MLTKVAPLVLILYQDWARGIHCTILLVSWQANLKLAVWNSSSKHLAFGKISAVDCRVLPYLTTFLLNHIHHATMMTNPNSSSSICYPNFKYQRRSLNSWKTPPWHSNEIPNKVQISRALGQFHKQCPLLFASLSQASQIGLSKTFLRPKLDFVGSMFLLARQEKDLILLGTLSPQIVF